MANRYDTPVLPSQMIPSSLKKIITPSLWSRIINIFKR